MKTRTYKTHEHAARAWARQHGFHGAQGGWIYNAKNQPVVHGWIGLAFRLQKRGTIVPVNPQDPHHSPWTIVPPPASVAGDLRAAALTAFAVGVRKAIHERFPGLNMTCQTTPDSVSVMLWLSEDYSRQPTIEGRPDNEALGAFKVFIEHLPTGPRITTLYMGCLSDGHGRTILNTVQEECSRLRAMVEATGEVQAVQA